MYEMASELLIVQDGTMPEVRMHGAPPAQLPAGPCLRCSGAQARTSAAAEQWQGGASQMEAGPSRGSFEARPESPSLAEGEQLLSAAGAGSAAVCEASLRRISSPCLSPAQLLQAVQPGNQSERHAGSQPAGYLACVAAQAAHLCPACAGKRLIARADHVAAAAVSAAAEVAARLEASLNRPNSAGTSGQSTPTRQRRRR